MKLKLNRLSPERSFRSSPDFARYAIAQAKKFEALSNDPSAGYDWWAAQLTQNWKRVAEAAEGDSVSLENLQTAIFRTPVFPFDSALRRTVQRLAEQGRKQGVQEIIPFLTGQNDGRALSHSTLQQVTAHSEYAAAIRDDASSRRRDPAFQDAMNDYEVRLSELLISDQTTLENAREQFATFLLEAGAREETLQKEAAHFIQNAKYEWAETHDSFIVQLGTETAVDLWSTRSETHTKRYRSFRKWTLIAGIAGVMGVVLWIFGGFALAKAVFPDDTAAQLASYTASSLAFFTLFVWSLRVLVRSMMSEDHLSTDASARSALAHTYLALTKEQAATPEDRAIILASLFAPVSDGLVKDDGMPALSPTAMAAQILTNPRG